MKPVNGVPAPSADQSQQAKLLPPFNLKTKEVFQVYPLEKFVPVSCFNALGFEADRLASADSEQQAAWGADHTYPGFILKRIAYLPIETGAGAAIAGSKQTRKTRAAGSQVTRKQAAINLVLLSHMFQLLKLRPRDMQGKLPLPQTPIMVSRHLLNEFTTMVGREGFERKKTR